MAALLLPKHARVDKRVGMVDPFNEDQWEDSPEYSDEFEPALWLIHHEHDIHMDPTVDIGKTKQERLAQAQLGVLWARFNHWSIAVNWQTQWARTIPPHHMAVEYKNTLVGILSPYLLMRTCWNCRRGNPVRANGDWDEAGYYSYLSPVMRAARPDLPPRAPAVLPAHPCPAKGCGAYDWFGAPSGDVIVRREDFQRDAAEAIADKSGQHRLATEMRMSHDPETGKALGMAKTGKMA